MNLLNAGLPSYVINQTSQKPFTNKSRINHTVESLLNAVEPTVESLRSLGLLQKAYVYGCKSRDYCWGSGLHSPKSASNNRADRG